MPDYTQGLIQRLLHENDQGSGGSPTPLTDEKATSRNVNLSENYFNPRGFEKAIERRAPKYKGLRDLKKDYLVIDSAFLLSLGAIGGIYYGASSALDQIRDRGGLEVNISNWSENALKHGLDYYISGWEDTGEIFGRISNHVLGTRFNVDQFAWHDPLNVVVTVSATEALVAGAVRLRQRWRRLGQEVIENK